MGKRSRQVRDQEDQHRDEVVEADGFLAFPEVEGEKQDHDEPELKRMTRPTLLNRVIFPWMKVGKRLETRAPPLVRLHNEILRFCDFLSPTTEETAARARTLTDLRTVVTSLWPSARVLVYGSEMTQIVTPFSDIDVAIMDVPLSDDEDSLVEAMGKLAAELRQHLPLTYLEVIVTARVPIIKFDHAETKVSVDICLNNDQGLQTGKLVQGYLRQYPELKPLMLTLKMFLVRMIDVLKDDCFDVFLVSTFGGILTGSFPSFVPFV